MPLLSNSYLKQFFAFLEFASKVELHHRREGLQAAYNEAKDRKFRQDLRWLLSRVEEEILTRLAE